MADKNKKQNITMQEADAGGYATSSAGEGIAYMVYPDETNNKTKKEPNEETEKRIRSLLKKLGGGALESVSQNYPELLTA